MKFFIAKLVLIGLILSGITQADALRNSNQRVLQQPNEIADIQAEISDLVDLIDSSNRRRQRRMNRSRLGRLNRRIARLEDELEGLRMELDTLLDTGGDNPAPPAPTGDLVTLDELVDLAIDAGLTVDDFDDTFGARSVTELLSRNSRAQIRLIQRLLQPSASS